MQFATGFCTHCCMPNWVWSCMCKTSNVQERFCALTDILNTAHSITDINDPHDGQPALGTLPVTASSSSPFRRIALWKKNVECHLTG